MEKTPSTCLRDRNQKTKKYKGINQTSRVTGTLKTLCTQVNKEYIICKSYWYANPRSGGRYGPDHQCQERKRKEVWEEKIIKTNDSWIPVSWQQRVKNRKSAHWDTCTDFNGISHQKKEQKTVTAQQNYISNRGFLWLFDFDSIFIVLWRVRWDDVSRRSTQQEVLSEKHVEDSARRRLSGRTLYCVD